MPLGNLLLYILYRKQSSHTLYLKRREIINDELFEENQRIQNISIISRETAELSIHTSETKANGIMEHI